MRMSRKDWKDKQIPAEKEELPKGETIVNSGKQSRNALCACGSKLKFKHCCMKKEVHQHGINCGCHVRSDSR